MSNRASGNNDLQIFQRVSAFGYCRFSQAKARASDAVSDAVCDAVVALLNRFVSSVGTSFSLSCDTFQWLKRIVESSDHLEIRIFQYSNIMSAYTFGAALELTSSPKLISPPAVKRKDQTGSQSAIELQDYMQEIQTQSSRQSNGNTIAAANASRKAPTTTPNELEMSRPTSPIQATELVPSWGFPSMNKYRVLAVCGVYFGNGINDACKY